MSFKEVKALRKSGKLEEAFKMAQQDLENDPDNLWNKRSLAWVCYDAMKDDADLAVYSQFIYFLCQLKALELPPDEKMLFDHCAFQVGKMAFALQKTESTDFSKLDELFDIIREFHFTKPSEAYSFLFKAFYKSH